MNGSQAKEIAEAGEIAVRVVERLVSWAKELDWLFAKVVSIPRLALVELSRIFTEIKKSVDAINKAATTYSDAIEDPDAFIDDNALLHDMSSSFLPGIVEAERGHCHEIRNIYNRYLSGYLSGAAATLFRRSSAKQKRIKTIFDEMGAADDDLFAKLTIAADKMAESARRAYCLKLTGQRQAAVDLIRDAGTDLLDIRNEINDADVAIRKIANKFVKAARVAPL
jgi:hypothetical protein